MKVLTDAHRLVYEMEMNKTWMLLYPELAVKAAENMVQDYPGHEFEVDEVFLPGYIYLRAYRTEE